MLHIISFLRIILSVMLFHLHSIFLESFWSFLRLLSGLPICFVSIQHNEFCVSLKDIDSCLVLYNQFKWWNIQNLLGSGTIRAQYVGLPAQTNLTLFYSSIFGWNHRMKCFFSPSFPALFPSSIIQHECSNECNISFDMLDGMLTSCSYVLTRSV